MSFGRKGLAPGQMAPAQSGLTLSQGALGQGAQGNGARDNTAQKSGDIAAKREAFIAAERARKQALGAGAAAPQPAEEDPLNHLRNASRPAPRPAQPIGTEPVGPSGMTAAQEAEIRAAARTMRTPSAGRGGSGYVFGDPQSRNVGLAYVLWFVLGQVSLHRFYCGQKESAIMQLSLFIGSIVTLFIFPPIGVVGFIAWMIWLFADLFMIPGMLRRFKSQHDYGHVFA